MDSPTTYSVQDVAEMYHKSSQTIHNYIKRGYLTLEQNCNMTQLRITEESVNNLPNVLNANFQKLRGSRSEYMKRKWEIIKNAQ